MNLVIWSGGSELDDDDCKRVDKLRLKLVLLKAIMKQAVNQVVYARMKT